ncbi:hypothetical protein [Dactylosporangium sp. CA-139066]|uniref:GHMP family kinase ATP-binding protein n=1 Tax=Dactylosporangium sp. CA-139066 TaxID=3239930 RepID=UPI003D923545
MTRLALTRPTQVVARAPLRVSFAGGGTDVMPYSGDHGGCVLSTTIDLYVHAVLQPAQPRPAAMAPLGPTGDLADQIDVACRLLGYDRDGFECRTHLGGLGGSGLGSSSAALVAALAALASGHGATMAPDALARLAYRIEREETQQTGGAQDHYAAAFGGLNFIEFGANGAGVVRPLRLDAVTTDALEASLLLCDTGIRRRSSDVLRRQVGDIQDGRPESLAALHRMKALAAEMRDRLVAGDLATFSDLMRLAWEEKLRLLGGIGDERIGRLLEAGLTAGALTGRLLGAGGGGFLLFLVPPGRRRAVADRLARAGGRPRPVALSSGGAQVCLPRTVRR